MASLEAAPRYSGLLFYQGPSTPHGPFASDDELWQSLVHVLGKLPEKARDAMRKRLPPYAPFTFSHGDTATVNIMVKNGNLTVIIDWDGSGYFPVWWEYAATLIAISKEDLEWKELLASKMQPFEEANKFWPILHYLREYPDLSDEIRGILEEELLRD